MSYTGDGFFMPTPCSPHPMKTKCLAEIAMNPRKGVRRIGLRYVTDAMPGIRRYRRGKSFFYRTPTGRVLANPHELRRIQSLVIPPAWEDVWICPLPNGHLQATGRDARGRKQYRYHPQWALIRNETKFYRLALFGHTLPRIRRQAEAHLRQPHLSYERVMAAVVRLLEQTAIRVGNAEYAADNGSFGLTTMRGRHVAVKGSTIRFQFVGKHGKLHDCEIDDPHLARIVRHCQDLPGYELFKYVDECGDVRDVDSSDVNEYIKLISGQDFTAKDFRTWAGTVEAALTFRRIGAPPNKTQCKKNVVEVVKSVAQCLSNRFATCKKYYVHPAIIEAYEKGILLEEVNRPALVGGRSSRNGLSSIEKSVLRILDMQPTESVRLGSAE